MIPDGATIKVGDRVYYTGDMSTVSQFGTVTAKRAVTYGYEITIEWEGKAPHPQGRLSGYEIESRPGMLESHHAALAGFFAGAAIEKLRRAE